MATYPDLTPLPYFGPEFAGSLVAIGWLGPELPFDRGSISEVVYRRLKDLLVHPFQPMLSPGLHGCELCRFEPEAHGSANLFVPADGRLLVCPELIGHYINAHGYRPPSLFCDAVMACPDSGSMEFRRRFLENGGRGLLRGAR